MKKFVILIAVFLACGGAVFYFGWLQFSLPANTHGVVFTKTKGWDKTPLVPGAFIWRWEKLIPGNLLLHVYPETIGTAEIVSQGYLPSARTYSVFLDGNPDFSFDLKIKVSYKIRPDYYPILASEHAVTPDGLAAWLEGQNTALTREAVALVMEFLNRTGTFAGNFSDIGEDVKAGLLLKFTYFDILSVTLENLIIPDMELYRKGRDLYYLSLDAKKEAVIEESRRLALDSMREEKRMESLQKYGELITKYPLLIEFLLLEKMETPQPSDLEHLRSLNRKVN
jgi:hypothetical protein